MARPPRPPAEGLLDRVRARIVVGGAAIGVAIFASFLIGSETSHVVGQTMAFTTLVVGRLLFVFTVRGDGPFWRAGANAAPVRRGGAVGRDRVRGAARVDRRRAVRDRRPDRRAVGGRAGAGTAPADRARAVEAAPPRPAAGRRTAAARERTRSTVEPLSPSIPRSRPTCSCATCTPTSTACPSAKPTGGWSATAATSSCAAAAAAGRGSSRSSSPTRSRCCLAAAAVLARRRRDRRPRRRDRGRHPPQRRAGLRAGAPGGGGGRGAEGLPAAARDGHPRRPRAAGRGGRCSSPATSLVLAEGDRVSADARLLAARSSSTCRR